MTDSSQPLRWSLGTLEQVNHCPVCGADHGHVPLGARSDDQGIFPDSWHYLSCGNCKALFLSPRPAAESLHLAYRDYYTHAPTPPLVDSTSARILQSLINAYFNSRYGMQRENAFPAAALLWQLVPPLRQKLDFVARHMPRQLCGRGRSLLDIGCGGGNFLALAREMGFQAMGCEPDSQSVALCRARGLEVVEGDAFHPALPGNSFDVITMNHVLEHVVEPRALLSQAFRLLAPGGRLWICLPNPEALGRRMLGIAWKGFHPPYHLVLPSSSWIQSALKEEGFQQVARIRRGPQSRGLWRESFEISKREGHVLARPTRQFMRFTSNVLGCLTPRCDEEQIHVAMKPGHA